MPITFVGIDLAWRRGCPHTAVAVRGNASATRLIAHCDRLACPEETAEFVVHHATANTVVAVNAPLVIRNRTGQRGCEGEVSRRFGRFGVSCPASNLSFDPHPAGGQLRELLAWDGFRYAPPIDEPELGAGRSLFEVHCQVAQIALFALGRIIDYRSGRMREARAGLRRLQRHLRSLARGAARLETTPGFEELLGRDVEQLCGAQIERYAASLDALFCSYLAWHGWRLGRAGNEMIGDLASGCIVVPTVVHDPWNRLASRRAERAARSDHGTCEHGD
jgi:predicted RNase H-like nuclease